MIKSERENELPEQLDDLADELMALADSLDVLARDVQRIVDRLNGLIAALRA